MYVMLVHSEKHIRKFIRAFLSGWIMGECRPVLRAHDKSLTRYLAAPELLRTCFSMDDMKHVKHRLGHYVLMTYYIAPGKGQQMCIH